MASSPAKSGRWFPQKLLVVALFIGVPACAAPPGITEAPKIEVLEAPRIVGKVVLIQDGDTLTVIDLEDNERRLRLAGIDAPEKSQPFGYASLSHLSDLSYGMLVDATCPKIDRYGRHVCTVLVNGKDISLAQVAAGFAWHFKRFEHEQPPEERDAYRLAEKRARAGRLGLWQDDHPMPPWDWRARRPASPR
jgi:endonuclease YncB( thermonuclease family)